MGQGMLWLHFFAADAAKEAIGIDSYLFENVSTGREKICQRWTNEIGSLVQVVARQSEVEDILA